MPTTPATPARPCPRDGKELTPKGSLGVEFLACYRCGGLWFPRAGLERLELRSPRGSRPPKVPISAASPERPTRPAACVCRTRPEMRAIERQGVTVDVCPACDGVWLDAGEIERILQCYPEPQIGQAGDGGSPANSGVIDHATGAAFSVEIVGCVLEFLVGLGGPDL